MCDCYHEKCAGGCGVDVGIHIADWNVARKSVEAYCPNCARKLRKKHSDKNGRWPKLIDDKVAHVDQATYDKQSGTWGCGGQLDGVLLCSDHKGFGIYFN